jgi:hypothetical protein
VRTDENVVLVLLVIRYGCALCMIYKPRRRKSDLDGGVVQPYSWRDRGSGSPRCHRTLLAPYLAFSLVLRGSRPVYWILLEPMQCPDPGLDLFPPTLARSRAMIPLGRSYGITSQHSKSTLLLQQRMCHTRRYHHDVPLIYFRFYCCRIGRSAKLNQRRSRKDDE